MSEKDPRYLGLSIKKVSECVGRYASRHTFIYLEDRHFPRTLVVPLEAIYDAGILQEDDNEDDFDLDDEDVDKLLESAIDPSMN